VVTHLTGSVNPAVKARWRQAYKLQRYGLTQEQFDQMLESQGYACAMGREPFEEGQQIRIIAGAVWNAGTGGDD
jgi:hypothetical protein